MNEEVNVVLGQRLIEEGKLRLHWQADKEFFPIKPYSKVSLRKDVTLIPVEESWLKGKKEDFEAFTIPYYDFVYMKDLSEPKESYIVQPFLGDLVVIDIDINERYLDNSIIGEEGNSYVRLAKGKGEETSLIEDYRVVAGLDYESKKEYNAERVKEVDFHVGFNKVWKEDLEKLVEAFYYTLSVTRTSLDNALNKGSNSSYETDLEEEEIED